MSSSCLPISAMAPLAASSDYQFWYEATANKGTAFTGASALTQSLGNKLISFLQKKATTATSAAVVALPTYNTAAFPIVAGTPPIAIGSHAKQSCLPLQNQN